MAANDVDDFELNDNDLDNNQSSSDEDSETESEDSGDETLLNPVWCNTTAGLKRFVFTKENGLQVPLPGNNEPIDWFNLLVDDQFLQFICTETNKYALELYCGPNTNVQSRITKWKDLTVPELKIFLGLLLHTGSIRLNRLQDYWKKHYLYDLSPFRKFMSRDRFLIILRCLHFSNATPHQQPTSRTDKVEKLVEYFNDKMATIYYPGQQLSIDEAMVLWRGRLVFRQYIKGKRHKYGIKLYSVNEPEGLTMKFKVYAGGQDELAGKGHASKVVMYLMKDMLRCGHSLHMDNFYNSFALAAKLLSKDTFCTGTLRADRKHNPTVVKSANLRKGETIAQYAEGVLVGKWRDKRTVMYISTEFENNMVSITNRRGQEREKPLPIVQYNAHMKGVDRMDQMMSYYPCERKSLRWYKKIFVHILQMLVINAYHLHNMHNHVQGRRKMTMYDFRLKVLEELLTPPAGAPVHTPPRNALHRIVKSEERDERGGTKRKRCRECFKDGKKTKRTIYVCDGCPDKPGLCPEKCFDKFHLNKTA